MPITTKLKTLISVLVLTVSIQAMASSHDRFSTEQLKNLIECKASVDDYQTFAEDYEPYFKQLGWKRKDDPDQPLLYIYQNKQPLTVYGYPTQEVALAGQGVVGVYRNTDYQPFAKELEIQQHPDFVGIPIFRGEKLIKTEPATADRFTFYIKQVLSEMSGKSPMSILGCTYEPDKTEVDAMLGQLDE